MIKLENDFLIVELSALGAELQSLFRKDLQQQYLWNADAAYWGKHSPVLFPIVGSLLNDHYTFAGKSYKMGRHGFAREKSFASVQLSAVEVLFTLADDESTHLIYPFRFSLGIRYRLLDNTLHCSYEVFNPGTSDLYFSIGGHPAFAVPNSPGKNYADYFLQFNNDTSLTRWKLKAGLVSELSESIPLSNSRLPLAPSLFYDDAIVLKSLASDGIRLGNTIDEHGLTFSFNNFTYFGIWAARDAPFVCLEPWCGIADGVNSNQQLIDKEGIIKLAGGDNWTREWKVAVD